MARRDGIRSGELRSVDAAGAGIRAVEEPRDEAAERLMVAIERAISADYRNMTMRLRREEREQAMEALRRFFDDRLAGR